MCCVALNVTDVADDFAEDDDFEEDEPKAPADGVPESKGGGRTSLDVALDNDDDKTLSQPDEVSY
jgi:hypothetical protein